MSEPSYEDKMNSADLTKYNEEEGTKECDNE